MQNKIVNICIFSVECRIQNIVRNLEICWLLYYNRRSNKQTDAERCRRIFVRYMLQRNLWIDFSAIFKVFTATCLCNWRLINNESYCSSCICRYEPQLSVVSYGNTVFCLVNALLFLYNLKLCVKLVANNGYEKVQPWHGGYLIIIS